MLVRSWKTNTSFLIGAAIGRLCPEYKLRLLRSWVLHERFTAIDRFLFPAVMAAWAQCEYLKLDDPDEREKLKSSLMGGDNAAAWAQHYEDQPIDLEQRVGRLSYREACPLLPSLDSLLCERDEPHLVIQAGSSSGREISWLATRQIQHQYIGIDPYPEPIQLARQNHQLSNLSFLPIPAQAIPELIGNHSRSVIVFSSGSLQYVQPEHIQKLFIELGRRRKVELWLLEPADASAENPLAVPGSRWRGNFSFTHNYRYYAERAGWRTIRCEIIQPYAHDRRRKTTVHYLYAAVSGRTNLRREGLNDMEALISAPSGHYSRRSASIRT